MIRKTKKLELRTEIAGMVFYTSANVPDNYFDETYVKLWEIYTREHFDMIIKSIVYKGIETIKEEEKKKIAH